MVEAEVSEVTENFFQPAVSAVYFPVEIICLAMLVPLPTHVSCSLYCLLLVYLLQAITNVYGLRFM